MRSPKFRLFENRDDALSGEDVALCINEGRLYLANLAMKEERDEEAIAAFQKLTVPEASYNQAQVSGGRGNHWY